MAKLIGKQLKASTLMETIVALVIIATVFSLALTTLANLYRRPVSELKTLAQSKVDSLSVAVKTDWNVKNTKFRIKGLLIRREVEGYEGADDLFLQQWTVTDKWNLPVYERKELIYVRKAE